MSSKFKGTIERIKELSNKKGVTVIFDYDENSDLSQIETPYSYDKKSKILTIVVPELGKTNKELLLEFIRKAYKEEGLIWKASRNEALISYSEYTTHNKYQSILDFFEPILSKNDFSALKMSFFLRVESERGANVNTYKMDIRSKFDERGANIANLCSAGYFEQELQPLYLAVPKPEFYDYYEIVVGKKARALFIHNLMGVDDMEGEVNNMVNKAIKYHMDDFRIHGKGTSNVATIKTFFKSRTGKEDYTMEKVYEEPKFHAIEYVVRIKYEQE